jgi:hypothetical protein
LNIADIVVFGVEVDNLESHDVACRAMAPSVHSTVCAFSHDLDFLQSENGLVISIPRKDGPGQHPLIAKQATPSRPARERKHLGAALYGVASPQAQAERLLLVLADGACGFKAIVVVEQKGREVGETIAVDTFWPPGVH